MKHLKFLAAVCCVLALFTACGTKGIENGHEWVDLGLPSGLKWATCNVGATKPEEYGDYFAWGETSPKTIYKLNNYKWATIKWGTWVGGGGSWEIETVTKYNTNSYHGIVDNKTVLELADDAAAVNWGSAWRMPTNGEWGELLDECTWEWKDAYKGTTAGYLVTSKTNGNSIFLPAVGGRYDDGLFRAGDCCYWSSSVQKSSSSFDGSYAWYFSSGSSGLNRYGKDRYDGLSVRPVLGE